MVMGHAGVLSFSWSGSYRTQCSVAREKRVGRLELATEGRER